MGARAVRLLVVLLTASLLAVAPAPVQALAAGSLRLAKPAQPVLLGDRITLKGTFKQGAHRSFVVQRAKPGSTRWSTLTATKGTTTATGGFTAHYKPRRTWQYRAVLPATATRTRQVSSTLTVKVTDGWRSLAAGAGQTCAIKADRSLWCWGSDYYGELGNPNHYAVHSPKRVDDSTANVGEPQTWLSVAAGTKHTCGIRTDMTLWCWGDNEYGELGNAFNSGTTNANDTPLQVSPGQTWLSVSAAYGDTCAIRSDGLLFCWGWNHYGQLATATGNGTDNASPTPTQVTASGADQTWLAVSVGYAHVCGIRSDKTLWCWGINTFGELGTSTSNTTTDPNPTPTQVFASGGDQTWLSVTTGTSFSCGIRADKTLWCWGENQYGELGRSSTSGTSNAYPTPYQVVTGGSDQTWLSVTARGYATCGRRANKTLWCWGDNEFGQLGTKTGSGTTNDNPTPAKVTAPGHGGTWLTAAAGSFHACAILADHSLWCWGRNDFGQLGTGTNFGTDVPNPTPAKVHLPAS